MTKTQYANAIARIEKSLPGDGFTVTLWLTSGDRIINAAVHNIDADGMVPVDQTLTETTHLFVGVEHIVAVELEAD